MKSGSVGRVPVRSSTLRLSSFGFLFFSLDFPLFTLSDFVSPLFDEGAGGGHCVEEEEEEEDCPLAK